MKQIIFIAILLTCALEPAQVTMTATNSLQAYKHLQT